MRCKEHGSHFSSTTCVQLMDEKGDSYDIKPMIHHVCIYDACTKGVKYDGPMCPEHTQQVYGLETKQTQLKNNKDEPFDFKGLFATKDFKTGEKIIPYLCSQDVIICDDPGILVVNFPGYDPYFFHNGKSPLQYRSVASRANTNMKIQKKMDHLEGRKIDVGVSSLDGCNALFDHDVVTAFKDIKKGHEILLWYGNNRQERLGYSIQDNVPCGKIAYKRKRREGA